jgi:hypothetical protein
MAISPAGLKKVLADVKPDVKVDITPLYAVAGATDAVLTKLREVPGRVQTAVSGLPVKAQARATELSDKVVVTASSTYGVLASRGETVMRSIRKQTEVVQAETQVKAATAKSKATTTTARNNAAASKRATKAATTSASEAVESVVEAADAAIDEIG